MGQKPHALAGSGCTQTRAPSGRDHLLWIRTGTAMIGGSTAAEERVSTSVASGIGSAVRKIGCSVIHAAERGRRSMVCG
jgi:hypothetical protein